jgi:hypothetical protein
MCFGSKSPPPAPPPMPAQAPLPPPAILESAEGTSNTASALAATRGRNTLRIDRTQSPTGSTGSGLNIPT